MPKKPKDATLNLPEFPESANGDPHTPPEKRPYHDLARYLAAAVIAYQMGISPVTALKNYVDTTKNPPGELWYNLAEDILRYIADGWEQHISRPQGQQTVQ